MPTLTKEKTTAIKPIEFTTGYFMELECSMCGREEILAARTKKDLSDLLKENDWKILDSDRYGQVGYWCGCDYMD